MSKSNIDDNISGKFDSFYDGTKLSIDRRMNNRLINFCDRNKIVVIVI